MKAYLRFEKDLLLQIAGCITNHNYQFDPGMSSRLPLIGKSGKATAEALATLLVSSQDIHENDQLLSFQDKDEPDHEQVVHIDSDTGTWESFFIQTPNNESCKLLPAVVDATEKATN